MNLLQINSCNFGSTGSIMNHISELCMSNGINCYTSCPPGRSMTNDNLENHIFIGTRLGHNIHLLLGSLLGIHGLLSIIDTIVFLRRINKLHIDHIYLHNLHNCYINLPLLFGYIRRHEIPVIWTLHDCWAFTGRCPHFQITNCGNWETGCHDCPYSKKDYPKTLTNTACLQWKLKKRLFTGLKDLTIITPSNWLASLAKRSFLGSYPVLTIYNGIQTEKYFSNNLIHKRFGNKTILLGVAFNWDYSKGLDVFVQLNTLIDHSKFQIVLVGVTDAIRKKLPNDIVALDKITNQSELIEIYNEADYLINPTRQEVFGLVNVEALACGTPVIAFPTGGCVEVVNESCGYITKEKTANSIFEALKILEARNLKPEKCQERALNFSVNIMDHKLLCLFKDKGII